MVLLRRRQLRTGASAKRCSPNDVFFINAEKLRGKNICVKWGEQNYIMASKVAWVFTLRCVSLSWNVDWGMMNRLLQFSSWYAWIKCGSNWKLDWDLGLGLLGVHMINYVLPFSFMLSLTVYAVVCFNVSHLKYRKCFPRFRA